MDTFQDIERAGWVERAGRYRDLFGTITSQSIEPLLDALGDLHGADFLDIACGAGDLAGAAERRGALVQGVDFADTMVAHASARYPGVEFRVGDAQCLPYADGSFDAAACSFGLPHFADPERALRSVRRALRRAGRFAATTWCGPGRGGEFFEFVDGVIMPLCEPGTGLPVAPPMFRFGVADECRRSFAAAGFDVNDVREIELVWSTFSPRSIPEMIDGSLVGRSLSLRQQSPQVRERIARATDTAAEARRRGGKIAFRFPALLITASAC